MSSAILDTTLSSPLPLGFGLVRGAGMNVIDQTQTATAPAIDHWYSVGDVLSDGTNLQVCITAGLSGDTFPSSWNHAPAGNTSWGSTTFENQGTTGGGGYQYGFWILGEGPWDGFDLIWNQTAPLFLIGYDYKIGIGGYNPGPLTLNPPSIRFHAGCDGALGSGLPTPGSTGPDQGCDGWIGELPAGAAIIAQCYSRMAYYAMKWLPQHLYASDWDIDQSNQKMSPVGDWRALRCRIFDDMGNQTGYQWTQNPAWHFVEACLRCCMFPRSEFQVVMSGSSPSIIITPEPIPSDVQDKFDWGSIYEFAQNCDYTLVNGFPRFTGNYLFNSQTTLAAILEQILTCSKGYMQEYAGKIFLNMDLPRASTFVLTDLHYIPGSLTVDHKEVHRNANDYTYEFLDLLVPAIVEVASIDWVEADLYATIVTVQESPCAPWDQIEIGGNSNPLLNTVWQVADIIDDYTFTAGAVDIGSDQSGTGGLIGYQQSRFAKRAPQLTHMSHAVARGAIGP